MIEITLGADPATGEGGVTVPVYPQRHARLSRKLSRLILGVVEEGQSLSVDTILDVGQGRAWELLCILAPALPQRMSEWQFRGYTSADAMAAGDYDEDADTTSPSIPEIRSAIVTCANVSGLDFLTHAKGIVQLVDPTLLRALVSEQLMELVDSASTTSPSSPSVNGDSPSTSSGATTPTSTPSEDSRSLASAA
jgi:hypothetical protein